MYYVFYETGNDAFFKRITDAFCSSVIQSIVDDVHAKIEASQPINSIPSLYHIREKIDIHRKIWMPLNCTLFSAIYCGNKECTNNKIVLTSDQIDKFEISMTNMNYAFFRKKNYQADIKIRLIIQMILQDYRIINIHGFEHIPIRDRQDHNKYLRSYITKTNKLKDKAEGFVYVRAGTNSDYDYFKTNTKLPNLIVCDNFQQI